MMNRDRGQSTTRIILAGLWVIAAIVIVSVVGWQFGWWLEAKDAEKRSEVLDNSPSAQRGYRQLATEAIEVVLDPNSSAALVRFNTTVACTNIASIDPAYTTPALESFQAEYC